MIVKMAVVMGTFALSAIAAQSQPGPETPFFCNLKALTASERADHLSLSARLADAVLETTELADGYSFQIDRARISLQDLAAWSDFERRCCPFFDFALTLGRENGPLTLRLTGRNGVKPFIRSEFARIFR